MLHSYPQPGKPKARAVCDAFARGCGGQMVPNIPRALLPGPAMFYGVRPAWLHLWQQAKAEGREWFYADNAYFDAGRERYFRVCRNRLQHDGSGESDGTRMRALGITVRPWTNGGEHIVVCAQSDEFLRVVSGVDGGAAGWIARTLKAMPTRRPVIVREKRVGRPLAADLEGAWALVTHTSAAANEALIAGVPAFVTGECAASPMAAGPLSQIEQPRRPEGRERWAGALCDRQWTLDEIRNGAAWRALGGCGG